MGSEEKEEKKEVTVEEEEKEEEEMDTLVKRKSCTLLPLLRRKRISRKPEKRHTRFTRVGLDPRQDRVERREKGGRREADAPAEG